MATKVQSQEDNTPNLVVGLDIGTTKIMMVMGFLREDGKIEVCGYGTAPSIGVEYGLVFNVQETIDSINTAKDRLLTATGVPFSNVYVGVAGRHIKSVACTNSLTRLNGLNVTVKRDEIDKMTAEMEQMSMPASDIISVIPQYYEVDGKQTTRPVGTLCQRVVGHYQLITGDSFEVSKIILSVDGSNLTTTKPILEPIASAIVCLNEEEKRDGVALIDIGGGTTDLVIFEQGVPVFIKVIPVGGQVVTNDIKSLGITYEQAENLKVRYGSCTPENTKQDNYITIPDSSGYGNSMKISEKSLAQVINARVAEDILKPVKRAIDASGYADKIHHVVLTGGGSMLNGMQSLTEFIIQRRTRLGNPVNGVSPTMDSALKNPICSTALGLLRYGCLAEKVELPATEKVQDVQEEPKKSPKKPRRQESDADGKSPLVEKLGEWWTNIKENMTAGGVN